MPAADAVLLGLCAGLTLIGVVLTGLAWRRDRRGRVIQGVGLTLAPVALYLTGLLRLLWDGAVAVGGWAARMVLSPAVWFGLSLLAVSVVLWVVGGLVARRFPGRRPAAVSRRPGKAVTAAPPKEPADEDMAEIEALLKSRGIQ